MKPAVRYQRNHIIGFSQDEPNKTARIVLAIMIAPMMATPAFVCQLIPVCSLKHDISEQTQEAITLIHQKGGYTFLLMTDNLRANQACFHLHKEILEVQIFSEEFENLYLLYDPTHLLKNVVAG